MLVQSAARGKRCRLELCKLREEKRRQDAATVMQAAARGQRCRAEQQRRKHAAMVLQAAARGQHCRRSLQAAAVLRRRVANQSTDPQQRSKAGEDAVKQASLDPNAIETVAPTDEDEDKVPLEASLQLCASVAPAAPLRASTREVSICMFM